MTPKPALDAVIRLLATPIWAVAFVLPSLRPCPEWTFSQALRVYVARLLVMAVTWRASSPLLSLEPGRERERFTVCPPAPPQAFVGVTRSDADIFPAAVGATWYPARPQVLGPRDRVVLHFHGGAYVVGDGRQSDCGFLAHVLLEAGKTRRTSHVLCPQYRLSGHQDCRFPAALQDAISSYYHLVHNLRLRADQIVLSGDSAGGHLVLALLRYIEEHSTDVNLQPPSNSWLWSPWLDAVSALHNWRRHDRSRNYKTDYTTGAFGRWGASRFSPNPCSTVLLSNPYVQALGNPFKTASNLFICAGGDEIFIDDNLAFAQQMRGIGNSVDVCIISHAPHDVLLLGGVLGFAKEALEGARTAMQNLSP